MNLKNGLEDLPIAFYGTTITLVLFAILVSFDLAKMSFNPPCLLLHSLGRFTLLMGFLYSST